MNNKINGMSLTFTFDYASPSGWAYRCKTNPNYRDSCIRNYALHEFGHAIGLEHEANRSDATCSESTNQAVISIGNYDANSIMNYCNNKKYIQNNWKPKLSVMDVSEIKKLYAFNSNLDSGSTGSNISSEFGQNFVKDRFWQQYKFFN
ncbi:MAG: M12 family metallo-peptidase [Oligoflexales bacterium]